MACYSERVRTEVQFPLQMHLTKEMGQIVRGASGSTSTCLTYSHTPKAQKGGKFQTCCHCKTSQTYNKGLRTKYTKGLLFYS